MGTKIQEQKFQKIRNKNYKNMGTKITKIRELKLHKSGNKLHKSGKKFTRIQKQKLQKSRNNNYVN
jgi:hypothetical protein